MEKQIRKFAARALQVNANSLRITPVQHGRLVRNNIWKVCTTEGKAYAIKQFLVPQPERHAVEVSHLNYSPLAVEANILKLLRQVECPVPDVIAGDETAHILCLEWCGGMTLDDVCQFSSDVDKKRYNQLAIAGFCQIESAFAENAEGVEQYIYPMDYQAYLYQGGEALLLAARRCLVNLAWLRGEPITEAESKLVEGLWNEIVHDILKRKPSLGSLDYNALNIIADQNQVYFIDFSRIGWDWAERRLIQYFTGLGAHKEGGNFITLLDKESVARYAEIASRTDNSPDEKHLMALVDYHHIVFYLTIIRKLLGVLAKPEHHSNVLLSQAWGPIEPRLKQAFSALTNDSFSDDRIAALLRQTIRSLLKG